MRRLPVYFLIDVSESMVGDPIKQVESGMRAIISELRTDPYALETVYISIIVFAGRAMQLSPLEELYRFYPPQFPIGGGTALGTAMDTLMDHFDSDLLKTTAESKGDWKPIVFLFTDGTPTDSYDRALIRWRDHYRRKANLVAISIGDNADTAVLGKFTENVLRLKDTDAESFRRFFKWVTASIRAGSERVAENNGDDFRLPPHPSLEMEAPADDEHPATPADENFAVMLGKCSNTRRPYLMKFARRMGNPEDMEQFVGNNFYLIGSYTIDEEQYRRLSDPNAKARDIEAGRLLGQPVCPCCGNVYGLVVCGTCGHTLCAGEEGRAVCPWCQTTLEIQTAGGDSGFDINRTIG